MSELPLFSLQATQSSLLWEGDKILLSENWVRILMRDPRLGGTKLPVTLLKRSGEKTVEVLIRELIKGTRSFLGVFLECFLAAAGFLTSPSVDIGVSTLSFNSCAASWETPVPGETTPGTGSHSPKVWEELEQIFPLCCWVWGVFSTLWAKESAAGLGNSWMGMWGLVGVEGLEAWLRFQRNSVPRKVRVQGCAHKAGGDNPNI